MVTKTGFISAIGDLLGTISSTLGVIDSAAKAAGHVTKSWEESASDSLIKSRIERDIKLSKVMDDIKGNKINLDEVKSFRERYM